MSPIHFKSSRYNNSIEVNWDKLDTIMLSLGGKEMFILDVTQIYNNDLNST